MPGSPLPSRTEWTRLVPPPVLTGHVSSFSRGAVQIGEPILLAAGATTAETTAPEDEEMGDADEAAPAPAPAPGAPPARPPPAVLSGHDASLTPY